jgi:outer membrane lipoprotein-sorting protein
LRLLLAAALGLSLGAAAAPKAAPPAGGIALLEIASGPPRISFTGKKLLVTWFGKNSKAREVRVYFKPPDMWRNETLSPSGKIERVSVSKDDKQWEWRSDKPEVLERDVADPDGFDAEYMRRLLMQNHRVEALGVHDILRRHAAEVSIVPRQKAGSKLEMWVEPETGIVLRRRQSDFSGTWVHESKFETLEPAKDLPNSMFEPPSESGRQLVRAPARKTLDSKADLEKAGYGAPWLEALPFGYTLETAAIVPIKGGDVIHFRYTNGLSLVSLFVSKRRISPSALGGASSAGAPEFDFTGSSSVGNVVGWQDHRLHYVLVGELGTKSLQKFRWAISGQKKSPK